MDIRERQSDEIDALKSIYDHFQYNTADRTGLISITVELPEFGVDLFAQNVKTKLNNLPPIKLKFKLHDDYPTASSPYLTLSCGWLDIKQLGALEAHLQCQFESDLEVLFDWISALKDDSFDILKLSSGLRLHKHNNRRKIRLKNKNRLESEYLTANKVIPTLIEFDNHEKQEEFNMQVVKCDVCLSNKSGSMCTQLSCEHIFCRNCLEEYFSILISEGSVLDLKCPSCSQPIAPNIIKSTITDELFQRFDRLMMERCLEKMDDIHYCPRPSCRTPCILLSKDDNTCLCASCQFCFCTLCQRSSHGSHPCAVNSAHMKKLISEYQRAVQSGDQGKIKSLMSQYGNGLKKYVELQQSMDFIRENTVPCPKCRQAIQKTEGCNKMTCTTCQTSFCYICGEICDRNNPYSHFNNSRNACFGQLFQGVVADEFEVNWFDEDDDEEDDYDQPLDDEYDDEFYQFLNQMKWLFIYLLTAVRAKKPPNSTPEVTINTETLVTNVEHTNQTLNGTMSSLVSHMETQFDMDGGVVMRGFVLVIICLFIFMSSCMLKRSCRKKTSRRYQILEENQLNIGGDESDSDVDIFQRTTKS